MTFDFSIYSIQKKTVTQEWKVLQKVTSGLTNVCSDLGQCVVEKILLQPLQLFTIVINHLFPKQWLSEIWVGHAFPGKWPFDILLGQ